MPDIPFALRVLVLLGFLVVVAAIDRMRYGAAARRWHEYLFLLAAGAAGSAFAVVNDQLTVTISTDYFVYGKLLDPSDLRWNVTVLALEGGLAPGLLVGGALLLVNQPRPDRAELPYAALIRAWVWPLGCAVAGAAVVGPLFRAFDPLRIAGDLGEIVAAARIPDFLLVQGIHFGLYVGGAIGLVVAAVRVWRGRLVTE